MGTFSREIAKKNEIDQNRSSNMNVFAKGVNYKPSRDMMNNLTCFTQYKRLKSTGETELNNEERKKGGERWRKRRQREREEEERKKMERKREYREKASKWRERERRERKNEDVKK